MKTKFSMLVLAALVLPAAAFESLPTRDIEAGARQRMLDSRLLQAVSGRNVDEIRRLAAMGANPNASDAKSLSPLAVAMIDHGDPAVVDALLSLGARVDGKGACGTTALHYAASYGRLEAAKILVAHHAVVDARACQEETPLVQAAANARRDVLAYLLQLGADPNATTYEGRTPLMLAVDFFRGRRETLSLLLADQRTNVNLQDKVGMTALKLAVKNNDSGTVSLLLAAPGIDVNDDGGGVTALFLAELDNREEIAKLLRAAGAKAAARLALLRR